MAVTLPAPSRVARRSPRPNWVRFRPATGMNCAQNAVGPSVPELGSVQARHGHERAQNGPASVQEQGAAGAEERDREAGVGAAHHEGVGIEGAERGLDPIGLGMADRRRAVPVDPAGGDAGRVWAVQPVDEERHDPVEVGIGNVSRQVSRSPSGVVRLRSNTGPGS